MKRTSFQLSSLLLVVRHCPARHAGEPHAVRDDVVDFSVGQILRLRQRQVGRLGIEIAADQSLAGAVVAVANWRNGP